MLFADRFWPIVLEKWRDAEYTSLLPYGYRRDRVTYVVVANLECFKFELKWRTILVAILDSIYGSHLVLPLLNRLVAPNNFLVVAIRNLSFQVFIIQDIVPILDEVWPDNFRNPSLVALSYQLLPLN